MSPFARFIENGHPYYMLREVMRSTAGLETLCSDIFYEGRLKPGHRTSIGDRPMSALWQKAICSRYPTLKAEPEGLVYPVFFNITSTSESEISGGSSRVNSYNVAAVIEHVIWVVCEANLAQPGDIGIATPYAAQVDYSRNVLRKVEKEKPEYDWHSLRIGTTEWFQGREADYLIVDLVRATNDIAQLGFMSEGRRLNVLLSRQKQAVVIFGDKDCVKPLLTGDEKEDARMVKRCNHNNRHLIKVFAWLDKKGRCVDVPTDSLPKNYVQLNEINATNNDNTDDQPKPIEPKETEPKPTAPNDTQGWNAESAQNTDVPW